MGVDLTADDVLRVAERIESKGAAFYRRASELHPHDPGMAALLRRLEEMELEHAATFAGMRASLPDATPDQTADRRFLEASLYLEDIADTHGGEGSPFATAGLSRDDSMEEILGIAVGLEQQSIAFYVGLLAMVSEQQARERLHAIIAEEQQHVVLLTDEIRALRSSRSG
jgi:rubrerythrin